MPLSLPDWHKRYHQQAEWTRSIRLHILQQLKLDSSAKGLEVGCGTGAILTDLYKQGYQNLLGVDIQLQTLEYAIQGNMTSPLICANGLSLPFAPQYFDFIYCHYLLMWLKDPHRALLEMKRVVKPGGVILLFAEPDYGGHIAHPAELERIVNLQVQSLRTQGVDVQVGRKLQQLLLEIGLEEIQSGIIGAEWSQASSNLQSELEMIQSDLEFITTRRDASLAYLQSRQWQGMVYFIPTFYAFGRVSNV
jgi:ubiquinone/menaquinone biosynthesis C-methylase UbiE